MITENINAIYLMGILRENREYKLRKYDWRVEI